MRRLLSAVNLVRRGSVAPAARETLSVQTLVRESVSPSVLSLGNSKSVGRGNRSHSRELVASVLRVKTRRVEEADAR
ncbi:hypothetical protein TNCV_1654431 [Trichonephila clavipes]|nr:hypothetical protein TNCV_1654431 [Trichonephila clavipes]